MPGITIDGTDPDEIAAAFAWAVERARAGKGPALIELVSHAHVRPRASRRHALSRQGSAARRGTIRRHRAGLRGSRRSTPTGRARDPIRAYAARLEAEGVIAPGALDRPEAEAEAMVEAQARAVVDAPWPAPAKRATACWPASRRASARRSRSTTERPTSRDRECRCRHWSRSRRFDRKGSTLLEAVMLGVADALARRSPRVRLRGGRRRQIRQCVSAAAAVARRSSAIGS